MNPFHVLGAIAVFGFVALFGWVNNIIQFVDCDFEAPYREEVVRGVGIPFAPLGAVAGYFDIDKE